MIGMLGMQDAPIIDSLFLVFCSFCFSKHNIGHYSNSLELYSDSGKL